MQQKSMWQKLRYYLVLLERRSRICLGEIEEIGIYPCECKNSNELPSPEVFQRFGKDALWGNGVDTQAWFHFRTPVVGNLGRRTLLLNVCTDRTNGWDANNPQFLAYVDGEMRQGLDINHQDLFLDPSREHDVYLYANTGVTVERAHFYAKLIGLDLRVEKLWYDLKVPFDSLSHLEEYSNEYQIVISHLNTALDCLNMMEFDNESEAFYASLEDAIRYMDEVFYGQVCGQRPDAPKTVCIGHTHIDCAWLWTLKQTREKVQRSFSTVIELMEQYPEYRFMSSQALLYKFLKEEVPEKYERVKELIREGRWECEGAMWVEADCNLSSGESLVRQILYGKRFFKEEFGLDHHILWLPDVFGYSAALPQILRKSGVDWFVTSKISWNDCNQMPYDTFEWQGIDGSRVHSYFLTAQDKVLGKPPKRYTTYVAFTTPSMVAGTFDRYQQKALNNEALLTFGYGDGGGGPTKPHLEMARRLSHGIPGTPKAEIGFAGDFLARLEQKMDKEAHLPVWRGELYLEHHRGTYTSVHKNKKNNRRSEFLYQNAEWLSTVSKLLCGKTFPKEKLHRGWEMILTNQFHDILPGSSIGAVYDQCDLDYAEIREIGEWVLSDAKTAIASGIAADCGYVIFNPNATEGNGTVTIDGVCCYVEGIPPKGYACVKSPKHRNTVTVGERMLENRFYRLTFDADMLLSSIYDKRADREVLQEGKRGNEIRIYADFPAKSEAWDWTEAETESSYMVLTNLQSSTPVQDGARAGIRIERRHMDSTLTQTVWLYDDIDRIDFDIDVNWKQRHQMVKAAFPVDVNSDRATYEIQYGSVERPTHKNTPWDAMKFEVCAHKFADLSEGNYGVALLNDCKYGHDIHDGEMVLSLLRSPTYPDPNADLGRMQCTYALVPHVGAVDLPHISAMAYALNNPMQALPASGERSILPESYFLVESNRSNVVCEVVKEAEDSEDTVIRLYENSNSKTRATLTFGFDVESVTLCDLMENEIEPLEVRDNKVTLIFGAFEIHTLKVK